MHSGWILLPIAGALCAFGCGPEYPNCDEDGDCHEAEFCVNGQCQQCRGNEDCEPGYGCNGGRCDPIPGYCTAPGDCGPDQRCEGNRCVSAAASTSGLDGSSTESRSSCEYSPVYFGFDADALDVSARTAVQQNLECLRQRGVGSVHVTGYADPRGTEEYNLALGDRRARSVMEYANSLGAGDGNVSSSSMGEEMATGEDDSGFRHDRRVEFVDR